MGRNSQRVFAYCCDDLGCGFDVNYDRPGFPCCPRVKDARAQSCHGHRMSTLGTVQQPAAQYVFEPSDLAVQNRLTQPKGLRRSR